MKRIKIKREWQIEFEIFLIRAFFENINFLDDKITKTQNTLAWHDSQPNTRQIAVGDAIEVI